METTNINPSENINYEINNSEVKSIFTCWFNALGNFFNAKGRVSCYEYWSFQTVNVFIFILATLIGWIFSSEKIVLEIFALYFMIPVSSASARRLHDIGISGKWSVPNLLLTLLTIILWELNSKYLIISVYALLVYTTFLSWILISAGEESDNIYGSKVNEPEIYTQDSIFFIRFMAVLLAVFWLLFVIKVF